MISFSPPDSSAAAASDMAAESFPIRTGTPAFVLLIYTSGRLAGMVRENRFCVNPATPDAPGVAAGEPMKQQKHL
jgi:hypothetical protein